MARRRSGRSLDLEASPDDLDRGRGVLPNAVSPVAQQADESLPPCGTRRALRAPRPPRGSERVVGGVLADGRVARVPTGP
jgi:hypothetical protein